VSFTGVVYVDLDWSFMPDAGEPRLSGWTVQLLSNGVVLQSTTTNANGEYLFTDAPVGNFVLCVLPKAGYSQIVTPQLNASCASGMGQSVYASMDIQNTPWEGLNFAFWDNNTP
jgi:hypothetical protein